MHHVVRPEPVKWHFHVPPIERVEVTRARRPPSRRRGLRWLATAALGLAYAWINGDLAIPEPANPNAAIPDPAMEPAMDPVAFDWSMLTRLGEFMLLPIGYLRLAAASDTLVLTPTIADIGIRVLIGIPFLFLLLSLRQFFRSRAPTSE